MIFLKIFLLVLFSINQVLALKLCNLSNSKILDNNELLTSYPAQNPKAITVILHGLNLKPSKMDPLKDILLQDGHIIVKGILKGHNGDLELLKNVHAKDWRNNAKTIFCNAYYLSQNNRDVPIYFLGYSLGALVGLEFLSIKDNIDKFKIKKMFLIAPAFGLRFYIYLINLLFFLDDSFVIKSKSLKEYRINLGTPLAAYRTLFEVKKLLLSRNLKKLNIDTKILLHRFDEFIDTTKIENIITQQKLDNWKTIYITNKDSTLKEKWNHLIIDKPSMGEASWNNAIYILKNHFK